MVTPDPFTMEHQREQRFSELRGSDKNPLKTLVEINKILEAEGFPESRGAGFIPNRQDN